MSRSTGSRAGRIAALLLVVLLLAAIVVAAMNRQAIKDHLAAGGFDPTEQVLQVLDDLDLTDAGERIFLASGPTVDGSQTFNEQCADVDHSEQGHVLGCFTGERIHLFSVTDERISGIVEVTAAHELLHAAYTRLGDGDRTALNAKLLRVFDDLSEHDDDLRERMSVYTHLSDAAFANELHSVLGTEVRDLPDWLEEHYAQWFEDRAGLVDRFEAYHTVFADLQDRSETLQAEMIDLRTDVERRKVAYDDAVAQFNADADEFSRRNRDFEFSGRPEEFEQIRSELESRRDELASTLDGLQADIDRYNAMRDELQELSEVSNDLDQQLNSDLAPVTTKPDDA